MFTITDYNVTQPLIVSLSRNHPRPKIKPTEERRKIWRRHKQRITDLLRVRLLNYFADVFLLHVTVLTPQEGSEIHWADGAERHWSELPIIPIEPDWLQGIMLYPHARRLKRIIGRYAPMIAPADRKLFSRPLRS